MWDDIETLGDLNGSELTDRRFRRGGKNGQIWILTDHTTAPNCRMCVRLSDGHAESVHLLERVSSPKRS